MCIGRTHRQPCEHGERGGRRGSEDGLQSALLWLKECMPWIECEMRCESAFPSAPLSSKETLGG